MDDQLKNSIISEMKSGISGMIDDNVDQMFKDMAAALTMHDADGEFKFRVGFGAKLIPRGAEVFVIPEISYSIRRKEVGEARCASGHPELVNKDGEPLAGGVGSGDVRVDDDMLKRATRFVVATGKASISGLQRDLRISYLQARVLMDALEVLEVVGPAVGKKPREVLIDVETADQAPAPAGDDA